MVLGAPGSLLTPPPSSSPPKTPHLSYSSQTRSKDEEKNTPPKPYPSLQTRTRHRLAFRPHVPMLMRGNTPPTSRSPPHQSRPTGNPPNLRPSTVSEEEQAGRDPTSRLTPMREAPYCRPPQTTRHVSQPRSSSTSHPPQQQDTVHRELRPGTGKGTRAGAGLMPLDTLPAACPARAPPPPPPALLP
jgi:hypothetical protein